MLQMTDNTQQKWGENFKKSLKMILDLETVQTWKQNVSIQHK